MVEYSSIGSVRIDVSDVQVGESSEDGLWGDVPLSQRDNLKTIIAHYPYTLDDRIQECIYDHPRIFYVNTLNMIHSVVGQCHYWQSKKDFIESNHPISINYLGLVSYGKMPQLIRHYKEMAKFVSARISIIDNPRE